MIRVILGIKKEKHVTMMHMRQKIKMFSVKQISVYHMLLETYNIIRNSASEQIKMKWIDISEKNHFMRSTTKNDLKVPMKPSQRCQGFTYNGSKLFNLLPIHIRETLNPNTFKSLTKKWIWENIPSY